MKRFKIMRQQLPFPHTPVENEKTKDHEIREEGAPRLFAHLPVEKSGRSILLEVEIGKMFVTVTQRVR